MGLREGIYAKIWSANQNGKLYSGKISVSKKNKTTGSFEDEFNGFVNLGGNAAKKAFDLGLPQTMNADNSVFRRIKVTSSPDVSTWFNKKKYIKMKSVLEKLIKESGEDAESPEIKELISCIGNGCDNKNITIWDFEIAEDNVRDAASYNNKKSSDINSDGKLSALQKRIDEDEEDDELPF